MEQLSGYSFANNHPDVAPRRNLKLYRSGSQRQHCGSYSFKPHEAPVIAPIGFLSRLSLRKRGGRWGHRSRIDDGNRTDIAFVGIASRHREVESTTWI